MKPSVYCRERVKQHDAGFYVAMRRLPDAQRDAALALMAFYLEVDAVILTCQEPAVAFAKLNWWRLEVTKCIEAKPVDHPVLQALQHVQLATPFALAQLIALIESIAQNLQRAPFVTFEDVMLHWIHTAGLRERLLLSVIAPDAALEPETMYQFMMVYETANLVRYLRHYVRAGVIMLGEDELQKFHVTPTMLAQYRTTPAIQQLLHYQLEKSTIALKKALSALKPQQRLSVRYLIVRARMAEALLQEIKQSQYAVLENFISLTPLRLWWLARKSE